MKKQKLISTLAVIVLIVLTLFLMHFFLTNKNEIDQNYLNVVDNSKTSTTTDNTKQNPKPPVKTETTSAQSETYLNKDGIYVVQYTANGFVPSSLRIPRGKSVKFINVSSRGMRIISSETKDQRYMELSESKTVGKGSSYTFSFIYSGLWSYYNQSYPSHTASILVY